MLSAASERGGNGTTLMARARAARYHQAQNLGLTNTETRFSQLNRRADELLQNVVDRING